ncbi:MAG TPA: hypothetical protein VHU80_20200 [Polyangiaceae bacterium]|jgi:hypothetical protein|nr:hypothetical protein [Polyangiaceae bacterium]
MGLRRVAAISCCAFAFGTTSATQAAARPPTERLRADPTIPRRARTQVADAAGSLVDGVELHERAALRLRRPDGPRWARLAYLSRNSADK